MVLKIIKQAFVRLQLQVFTTDFYGNNFLVRQFRRKATMLPNPMVFDHFLVVFAYQTVYGNDKIVSAHDYYPHIIELNNGNIYTA